MRLIRIGVTALIVSVIGAGGVAAQVAANPVQQAMRELMMAEEQYYSDHGTYTTDLAALGLIPKDLKSPHVWIRVYHAGGAGWIADAQGSDGLTGSCVAFVGDISNFASVPTTQGKLKPTEEGRITCDP